MNEWMSMGDKGNLHHLGQVERRFGGKGNGAGHRSLTYYFFFPHLPCDDDKEDLASNDISYAWPVGSQKGREVCRLVESRTKRRLNSLPTRLKSSRQSKISLPSWWIELTPVAEDACLVVALVEELIMTAALGVLDKLEAANLGRFLIILISGCLCMYDTTSAVSCVLTLTHKELRTWVSIGMREIRPG